jgi:ubiquinone/menaquinone biosynthesis C-methylase UbiE
LIHPTAAAGFSRGAATYDRGRPDYPTDAVAWLAQRLGLRPGRTVLDLAAGTGKLTRSLAETGAAVVAVEPVGEMRAYLEAAVPAARAVTGTAEAIPLADASVDAVTVAQAFHWFDQRRALAEIHRVLRRDGALALIRNMRDLADPLQRAIQDLLAPLREAAGADGEWDPAAAQPYFEAFEERRFRHEQRVDLAGLLDRVGSTSFVAALPDAERSALLARVRQLAADRPEPEPIVIRYETEVRVASCR